VFQPTRRGLQISDPAAYQAALDADVVSWTAQYDVSEAEARQMLETDHVLSQPLGGWPPSEELARVSTDHGILGHAAILLFSRRYL
jgi:hypothetical protein